MAKGWRIRLEQADKKGFALGILDPARTSYLVTVRLSLKLEPRGISVSAEDVELSGREVRRLPLDSYLRAAVAAMKVIQGEAVVRAAGHPKGTSRAERERAVGLGDRLPAAREELNEVMLPRGRPRRGYSLQFYKEILTAAERLTAQGKSAAAVIAGRKKVSENTVHQWLFRARQLQNKHERRRYAQRPKAEGKGKP